MFNFFGGQTVPIQGCQLLLCAFAMMFIKRHAAKDANLIASLVHAKNPFHFEPNNSPFLSQLKGTKKKTQCYHKTFRGFLGKFWGVLVFFWYIPRVFLLFLGRVSVHFARVFTTIWKFLCRGF